jgi:hypothetical protein
MAYLNLGTAFTIVAETGDRFADFRPYVPAIADDGTIAFQATLRDGGSSVCIGDRLIEGNYASHPDVAGGRFCAYAGGRLVLDGRVVSDLDVGPLGPTINEHGTIAFRAGNAIWRWQNGHVEQVAGPGEYEGLPVLSASGAVVYRSDGGIWMDGRLVVPNGDQFGELGRFPSVNDDGVIAFAATTGVYMVSGGAIVTVVSDGFESYRGALVDGSGGVVFYATPIGGTLGVYRGAKRLIGIGDKAFGSEVVEFALNPVSINRHGQLAIRVALAEGRQLLVTT